jgi:hypothetical protein
VKVHKGWSLTKQQAGKVGGETKELSVLNTKPVGQLNVVFMARFATMVSRQVGCATGVKQECKQLQPLLAYKVTCLIDTLQCV